MLTADRNNGSRRRRVAIFTGCYNHIADGVALTMNRLVGSLEREKTETLVFAPSTKRPAFQHNGTLVMVPAVPFFFRPDYYASIGLVGKAKKRLDEFDPDLIHIATPDYLGFSALRYGVKRGIPVVSSFHTNFDAYLEYYHLGALRSFMWAYGRWFYGHCEQVYVPTEAVADILTDHGVSTDIRLWPRGVDSTRFRPERRSMRWRRKHGFSDDEVVVLMVSRLVREKVLHVFEQSVNAARRRGLRFRALVVGDGPVRSELESKLPPDTVFTGHLSGADLATAYASSDVFLFPSDTETFGNVTLEAMASGLPAVCADAPGSSSLVLDEKTGFLCEPGDSESFADAIEQLVTNRNLRFRMGDLAAERARSYYWPVVLRRMSEYYDEVLGIERPVRQRLSHIQAETAAA